jgi:hypothetical protein
LQKKPLDSIAPPKTAGKEDLSEEGAFDNGVWAIWCNADDCTEYVMPELFYAQVTRSQGIFSLRSTYISTVWNTLQRI